MTVPPYEWPTRMAGLLTRPSARVTAAASLLTESRLSWADTTWCPSACSVGITLLKHEPSAHMPCANTMLGLAAMVLLLLAAAAALAILMVGVDRRAAAASAVPALGCAAQERASGH